MHVALKVDVDTARGTREGVPRLCRLFARHGIRATFFFTLGPDHTGRRIFHALRPDFLRKVHRTSVVANYGIKTLLYGVVLPGPMISRRCRDELRMVSREGHEIGLHVFDHSLWQDHVRHRDEAWTRRQLERGIEAFHDVWGSRPHAHAAAGWQINEPTLALEQEWGFRYASDCRGPGGPFSPEWEGRVFRCPQIPTTLPTLDEILGREGIHATNFADHLVELSRSTSADHVFTLHAELEGGRYIDEFERLLRLWSQTGTLFETLGERLAREPAETRPVRRLTWGTVPGRAGQLVIATPPSPSPLLSS